jgi:hypothetical protein
MALSFAATYDDPARREDLLGVMRNIRPLETRLVSGLGVSSATGTLHEWVVKALASVAANAQIEGADATYNTLTNPVRIVNVTQIFKKGFQVSDTERTVDIAGYNDRYSLEATDALTALKNDMELAALRGSIASGSGTGARQLRGIKLSVSNICVNSSVSLSETMLNDYFQTVWDKGTEVNAVYVGMSLKRRISGFTAGSTKFTDAEDKALYNAIDVYEADAARMVKLFPHRYVNIATETAGNLDLVALNEDYFKISYLRKPLTRELAKTGDATKGEVLTEMTMESHPDAGMWVKGLS